jgi:predicted ArsR family transcriptional regulator
LSQQIWTAQQAADYLEISKTAIEVAKSKKGKPTWLWELVDMLIPDREKNLFYRDDVLAFANKIERQEHTRYLVLNILDEIVSKGLMTVDELAIFLDINEASIRKYLACSDKPRYKRAVEILFKKIDEIEDLVKQEKKDFKEAKGTKYVKRDAVKKIIAAWIITVPTSALLAAGIYYMIKGIVAV